MATQAVWESAVKRLLEGYRRGEISRREFFQMLAFATGSLLVARDILLAEGIASEWEWYNWPDAQGQTPPTPKESITAGEQRKPAGVEAEWVEYEGGAGKVGAYLARPAKGAPFASIVVIHENRGLTEFVVDIAQRWAAEGLLGIAPDFLSRLGGTAGFASMDAAREGIGKLDRAGVVADLGGTMTYLKTRKDVKKERMGVSGFCWGGAQTFYFATESSELRFAAPFYGGAPPADRLEKIACPIFAVCAEDDQRVNASLDAIDAKMKELGKNFMRKIYPGTQHAFMNFTGPRYNAEQAKAAWADVTGFVKKAVS